MASDLLARDSDVRSSVRWGVDAWINFTSYPTCVERAVGFSVDLASRGIFLWLLRLAFYYYYDDYDDDLLCLIFFSFLSFYRPVVYMMDSSFLLST